MRSSWCARARKCSAARAAAAAPTWRRPAARKAPRPMRRSPRSLRRSADRTASAARRPAGGAFMRGGKMGEPFAIRRCGDVSRAGELHRFVQAVFGALAIDPPSSVLKETEADFAARLTRDITFVVEADG